MYRDTKIVAIFRLSASDTIGVFGRVDQQCAGRRTMVTSSGTGSCHPGETLLLLFTPAMSPRCQAILPGRSPAWSWKKHGRVGTVGDISEWSAK